MAISAPCVFMLREDQAYHSDLLWDGSFQVTFRLPNAIRASEAKLMFLKARMPLVCSASFVRPGAFGQEKEPLLGTSVSESNVYVPVAQGSVPAVGSLTFRRLDGKRLQKPPNIRLAIHYQ